MNYLLSDIPNSGLEPIIYMDIAQDDKILGRITARLFRDAFPAGVENFINIVLGNTYNIKSNARGTIIKETKRSYENNKFFNLSHNNYIMSGDIYNNNGSDAGTIYYDNPIPAVFGEYFYPHENKGLISLVPFADSVTGEPVYDSTFMITLDGAKPSNVLGELDDAQQVVIGEIFEGLNVLDKINAQIEPFAGRKYPNFYIKKCGLITNCRPRRKNY